MSETLTADKLRKLLAYDPETGTFTWRVSGVGRKRLTAGCTDAAGYRCIRIDDRLYRAHRLAWMYVYGVWPSLIDHVNGTRADNRLANLRLATPSQNAQNKHGLQPSNTSGYQGVSWFPSRAKWVAKITVNRKQHHLGYYDDIVDAHQAYLDARLRLHPFATERHAC